MVVLRDLFLDVEPVQIGGGNPRFKQHGDVTRSLFQQVKPASVSDIDPPSSAGIAQPVIMRAEPLIQKTGRGQARHQASRREKVAHAPS